MDVDDSLNMNFSADADVGDLDAEDALSMNFNWTVDQEILLFEAMMGHKPVGVGKNIRMMCIYKKMNLKWRLISKSAFITPQHIWAKLRSMYDLQALDNSECVPFPEKDEDFALPSEEFGPLMNGLPTHSNDTSRSSTVDREVEDDPKTINDSALKDESPIDDLSSSDTATTASSSANSVVTATTSAVSVLSSTPTTAATHNASASVTAAVVSATATPVTPSGPTATSTPTSKPGRKRSKATSAANQSEDKTPSGPSSAKRSRR